MSKTITLPYPPSLNNAYSTNKSGRRFLKDEGKQFKALSANLAVAAGCRVQFGEVSVSVDVFRPARRGDLDNTLKLLLDSLTGIAWKDDSQIAEIHARRFEDKINPRAVVRISPLSATENAKD